MVDFYHYSYCLILLRVSVSFRLLSNLAYHASAVDAVSSDALHTVGDSAWSPVSFAVFSRYQVSFSKLKLGWESVDVWVGHSPSGDDSIHTTWVFFGSNWDDSDLKRKSDRVILFSFRKFSHFFRPTSLMS